MSFGNVLREDILDEIFGAENITADTQLDFALSTTNPLDDGSGITEPVGDGYARVTEANDLVTWNAASTTDGGTADGVTQKTNAIEIEFPEATGSWGTITHFAIYQTNVVDDVDAFLGWGELTIPKTIEQGDTARFAIGDLVIQLS